MKALLATVCIVLSAVVVTVHGRSFSFSADNDSRRVIHLGTFAYSSHGVLRIALGAFDVRGGTSSAEPIGFALDPVANALAGRQQTNRWDGLQGARRCFVEEPGAPAQRQLIPLQGYGGQSLSRPLRQERTVRTPGYYALFFYNCNGYTNTSRTPALVSFDAHVESLSHTTNGHITYASIGNVPLGTVYLLFGIVFTLMAVLWAVQCRREAMQLHAVHSVMTVLIALKAATLFLNAMKEREHVRSGGVSGWDVASCVFTTLEGTTLFCVLFLLGSGWSVLKATLSTREKRILMVLIPCQVVTNVVMAVIQHTSEGHPKWQAWRDFAIVLDIVCWCCVLVPTVASINALNEGALQDDVSWHLRRIRMFYAAVVVYIYLTRIVLGALEIHLSYEFAYVTPLLREAIAGIFYAYTGYKFRPQQEKMYVSLPPCEADRPCQTV